ncbi:MAG: hypothetical protein WCP99_05130 [Burkholderiales bacterium]
MKSTQFLVRVLMVLVLALPSVYAADGDNLPGGAGARNDPRGNTGSGRDKHPDVDQNIDNNQRGPIQATRTMIDGVTGMTNCQGEYALCLASTCKPTGRKIKVKKDDGKSFTVFEESACTCPVITAEIAQQNGVGLTAIAAVNEGNMNGSCEHPPGKIWALYNKDILLYPQESATPPFRPALANMQTCPAGTVGSNCWNFECTVDEKPANGTRTATCFCAINDGQFGREVRPYDSLFTAAGGYFANPSSACSMYPANGWLQ